MNVPHTSSSSSGSSTTASSSNTAIDIAYTDNINIADSSTLETSSENYVTTQATISSYEPEQILDEIVSTTEHISTLHHVFAEPDTPPTTVPSVSVDTTSSYNFTAAELEAARSLERLIEVNRIVEVSFKEDKVKNSSGIVESRTMLERVPTLDRIGAINRLTVINVVDGGNETNATFPANHAVTLNEIITGRNLRTGQSVDIVAKLHAPDIQLTKMNILNNTLEIIEALKHAEINKQAELNHNGTSYETKHDEISSEQITNSVKNSSNTVISSNDNINVDTSPEISVVSSMSSSDTSANVNQPTESSSTYGHTIELIETGNVKVVNGPKILDQLINDTVLVESNHNEPKFEIYSKSNVVDYSHRDFNAAQILSTAQQGNTEISNKQGRKLAIDSKSVVVNNNARPVFNEITTLPIEALFQTESPNYNQRKVSVTELPTLKEVVTGRGNFVDDDQDLLESKNVNGRVRIRILGQDDDYYKRYEVSDKPVFAPIRILKGETEIDNIQITSNTDNIDNSHLKTVSNYKTSENTNESHTDSGFLKQETSWNYSPIYNEKYHPSGDKSTLKSSHDEDSVKSSAEAYTLRADVVEVTSKPQIEMIRIAPIEVSLSKSDRVSIPVIRVESSQSIESSPKYRAQTHTLSDSPKLNVQVLQDDIQEGSSIVYPEQTDNQDSSREFFNAEVIFGELKSKTETQRNTA